MLSITKVFEFAASHTLRRSEWSDQKNLEVFGKCANPNGHGHNFSLEISITGAIAAESGMIIDTKEVKEIVEKLVLQDLDHRNLNVDVPWLQGKIPSAEVLVEAIWDRLAPAFANPSARRKLQRLKLWESRTVYAIKEDLS